MSEFKQKHKDYLIKNDIKDEADLITFLEILRNTQGLSPLDRQMLFDFAWLVCNERDCLLSFFAAKNSPMFLDEVLEQIELNEHLREVLKGAGTKDHGEVKPNSTRHKASIHCGGYNKPIFKENLNLGITPNQVTEGIQKGLELLETLKANYRKRNIDVLEIGQIVGKKENKGKPQLSLLFTQFPKALEAVAKCSEYGHEKYKETDQDYLNYQRVEGGSKNYADAGLRHRAFPKGTTDIDSQLPHAYHVAWNALAELELILKNR